MSVFPGASLIVEATLATARGADVEESAKWGERKEMKIETLIAVVMSRVTLRKNEKRSS